MSILKWKDFNEILSIRDQVDNLFDRMFENTSFHSLEERYAITSSGGSVPEFSIRHGDADIIIQVALPGYERGDIKVSVSNNLLAIGSEISREREIRGEGAYRYHRSHGGFCKVMELPAGVDATNIKTSFENGVLEVVLPKMRGRVENTKNRKSLPANKANNSTSTDLIPASESLPDDIDEII